MVDIVSNGLGLLLLGGIMFYHNRHIKLLEKRYDLLIKIMLRVEYLLEVNEVNEAKSLLDEAIKAQVKITA